MFIVDPDRKPHWRPYHIYNGSDAYAVFALCGKVFAIRPKGVTTTGTDIANDHVCGICLAKRP